MEDDRKTYESRVALYAMCASINSASLGLIIGNTAVVSSLLQQDLKLTGLEITLYQSATAFFSIFGAATVSLVMDPFGRRAAFAASSVLFIVGLGLSASATAYAQVMVGAALCGVACGMGNAIDPLYIAELSPRSARGKFVTYAEVAISLGAFVACVIGFCVVSALPKSSYNWRVITACAGVSPVSLLLCVAFVLPESPRWLAVNGRVDEARHVLSSALRLAPKHVEAILDDVANDASLLDSSSSSSRHGHGSDDPGGDNCAAAAAESDGRDDDDDEHPWVALWRHATPATRRIVWVAVGVAAAQQLSGIDAVGYQFVFAIEEAGASTRVATGCLALVAAFKVATAVVAMRLLDSTGRRPLLVGSAVASCATLAVLGAVFALRTTSFARATDVDRRGGTTAFVALFVALSAVFVCAFEIGLGPGCWLVPSEILYNKVRLPAIGFSTLTNRFVAVVIIGASYALHTGLGWAGFYFVYAGTGAVGAAFLVYYLPETKGISLEEMYDYFDALVRSGLPGWLASVVAPHGIHDDGDDPDDVAASPAPPTAATPLLLQGTRSNLGGFFPATKTR
mmetsp:Transcript_14543/g.58040  ORF Transcript_14543/g.58040 Transcript_14543/m.58040 type:complete len:569 (+) Transcript_14543:168-1874(+)